MAYICAPSFFWCQRGKRRESERMVVLQGRFVWHTQTRNRVAGPSTSKNFSPKNPSLFQFHDGSSLRARGRPETTGIPWIHGLSRNREQDQTDSGQAEGNHGNGELSMAVYMKEEDRMKILSTVDIKGQAPTHQLEFVRAF